MRTPFTLILFLLAGATVGGVIAPDGATEVQLDLPDSQQARNISSSGLGCCVFRSLDHAARWCNEPSLFQFPEWMVQHRIPGGGYPEKVTELVAKIAKDRNLPAPAVLQVRGADLQILREAAANGIMPSVTYGVSPTGRYQGQQIAHMVNLVHADDRFFAVLDNNYIGSNQYEWMTPAEFSRSYTLNGGGWAVFLLHPGPPPVPVN